MSTYASVYRPTQHQQTLLTREQKRESRKRKREGSPDEAGKSDSDVSVKRSPSEDAPSPRAATSSAHPVNRTDPYYIAGLSREDTLPLYPFPHAPVGSVKVSKVSAEDALAAVKPPLYLPKTDPGEPATSLKRRHLDNVTAILHQCMLKGDWQRAARAWGLLLRTEISGRGIDIRQHGRWGIGAEILMRKKDGSVVGQRSDRDDDASELDSSAPSVENASSSPFDEQGFKLARDYYQRLVLQYPHIPRYPHSINALVFYPAFFNIWIYEVQDRFKRLRESARDKRPRSSSSDHSADTSDLSNQAAKSMPGEINAQELEEAMSVAQRLDELLLSPPYDTSLSLLRTRGMIGLWLSDLHSTLDRRSTDLSSEGMRAEGQDATSSSYADRLTASQSRQKAKDERQKARTLFHKVRILGGDELEDDLPKLDDEDTILE